MNAQVVAYMILFLAIFVTGFVAGDIGGDDFREVVFWIWGNIKKTKFNFFKKI